MHNATPLFLATLVAAGIIVIGCFYLVSVDRIPGTFGLKMLHPADAVQGHDEAGLGRTCRPLSR